MESVSFSRQIVLLLLFAAVSVEAVRYFVHVLQKSGWVAAAFLRLLFNESLRWIVLIFAIIPGTAAVLDFFSGNIVRLTFLYLLVLLVWYFPRKSSQVPFVLHRAKRLYLLTGIYSILIFILIFCLRRSLRGAAVMLLSLFLSLIPLEILLANVIYSLYEKISGRRMRMQKDRVLSARPDLTIIGITGTRGKTGVKNALCLLLAQKTGVLMTPDNASGSKTAMQMLCSQLGPEHKAFLCEIVAYEAGDVRRYCEEIPPDIGIITGIGYRYTQTFKTFDNIISTNYELFDAVTARRQQQIRNGQNPPVAGGCLFVNGDNQIIRDHMQYPDAVTYGLREDNDYRAVIRKVSGLGTDFIVSAPDGSSAEFHMQLIGRQNTENITGAIAIAHEMGLELSDLKDAVAAIKCEPHRAEISMNGKVTLIDDRANRDLSAAMDMLQTVSSFKDCLHFLITPGMLENGTSTRADREFGEAAADVFDYIILMGGDNMLDIRNSALDAGFVAEHLIVCGSLLEAQQTAEKLSEGQKSIILMENELHEPHIRNGRHI